MNSTRQPEGGFTYLGVLFILSVLAMTAAMASVVWGTAQQRDNERELVFAGRQFELAIERYRAASTNPASLYPLRLDDLVRDDRAIVPQHHLRRMYVDPMTGEATWGLIRLPDGGIVGVHSLSERKPYPREFVVAGFAPPRSVSYRDWRFVAPSAVELLAPPATEVVALPPPPPPPAVLAGEPAETGEPDVATPPVARAPSVQDYRTRTPEACTRIAAYDEQTCAAQASRFGDDAGRECRDSAVTRGVGCALGDESALPPLTVRNR